MKSIKSNMSHDFDIKSALRKRGYVTGEGGIDQIPAKLTKGEAVLPRKTVEALGGPEGVDELILRTTGKRSAPKMEDGELHAAEGWVGDSVDWLRNKVGSAAEAVGRMASPKGVEQTARAAGEAVKAGIDFGSGVKANYTAGYEAGPQAPKGPPEGIDKNFFRNRRETADILRNPGTEPTQGLGQRIQRGYENLKTAAGEAIDDAKTKSGGAYKYGKGVGEAVRSGGVRTGLGRLGGWAGAAAELLDDNQREFLTDPNVAGADKARQLVRSGLRIVGGGAGAGIGGTVGSVIPVAGTAAGAVGGGWAGTKAADALGDAVVGDPMKGYKGRTETQGAPLAAAIEGVFNPKQPTTPPPMSSLPQSDPSYDAKENRRNLNTSPALRNQVDVRPPGAVAADEGPSDVERQAMEAALARQNGENRMQAYARESALRKQMVEDNLDREYNPGTGLAEIMPETNMFGQTAAQRSADMDRFSARVALGRIGHGAGKKYAASQLAAAQGYNQLADDAIAAEQKGIDTKKEMVGSHLTRQAALRGKGMDVAAERQKATDVREATKYRDDRGLEGDKYKADAAVEAARLGLQGDLAKAYATKRAGEMKAKGDRETAGVKALTDRLVSMYGDPTKDQEAQKKINDRMNLLTGTMAKHGYSADLLNDPRILERLLVTTERQAGVRDSEKGIVAALKGLVNPNRRPALDSDIGTDYNPLAVGRQGMFGRDVRTAAGDTSQSVHEYGPDAGVLDQVTRSRLRNKQFLDSLKNLSTYDE